MSTGAPLRQPIPVGRSILWSPANGGAKRPGDIPFPIFLSQAALTAIHEHIATPHRPGQGILGFLLGDLCECPDTNVSYLVIDLALRLNQPIYGDRTRDVVTRLWDPIQGQLDEQRAHLLGWYHTHPPHPLVLSGHDVETHEHYFAERWQVALLLAPDAAEPGGSFFRAGGDDTWISTPLPFYELLSDGSIRPDGKKRSFMTWKDYRAFNSATPTADGRAAPGPPATRVAPPPRPSGPQFTPTPRPAPRLRRAIWVIMIAALAAGAYWWFQPRLPLPSVSASTIAHAWSALTDKWSALTGKVSTLTGKVSAAVSRLRRTEAAPPPRAPSAPRPQPGPAPQRVAPTVAPPSAAAVRLDQIGDSLTRAVRIFTDRRAQFTRSQVACPDLARSLEAVETRWIAYNTARRASGTLAATRAARDQALYAGVDSVEHRFEQSGCPRP